MVRASCTTLPLQRHEVRLLEHMDWALRTHAQRKSHTGIEFTDAQQSAVVARLQCKAAEELLDFCDGKVMMLRVYLD